MRALCHECMGKLERLLQWEPRAQQKHCHGRCEWWRCLWGGERNPVVWGLQCESLGQLERMLKREPRAQQDRGTGGCKWRYGMRSLREPSVHCVRGQCMGRMGHMLSWGQSREEKERDGEDPCTERRGGMHFERCAVVRALSAERLGKLGHVL